MKKRRVFLVCMIFLCAAVTAGFLPGRAKQTDIIAQHQGHDQLAESFFPPELIFQQQLAISLSEEQKTFIKGEVRKTQARFTELQWALQDEMEKLQALTRSTQVDEAQALAVLDKVLDMERNIKRAQIALLVRLKNKLTPEQQAQLRGIQFKPK